MTPPVALTIAGTDPSGGAGIAADLRTLAALGVHGTCVVAALTVQDTKAVHRVHPIDAGLLTEQLAHVTADLPPAATKTGLLATAANVEVVAAQAGQGRLGRLVVDPVLRASTGAQLTPENLADLYRRHLLPAAAVVTPNREEAAWLTGLPVSRPQDLRRAAAALVDLGAGAAVVTGGDLGSAEAVDVLAWVGAVEELAHPRVRSANTHGTGCTFSAAVAAHLAHGRDVAEAVAEAGRYVQRALAGAVSWRLGSGPGPLDQLGAAGG